MLNRVVRAVDQGWEYVPDQRHTELIVNGLGLEGAMAVRAAGEDKKAWEKEDNARSLNAADAVIFRSIAARCNYSALDRADIHYATKGLCRGMASPSAGGGNKLNKLGRNFLGVPRVVTEAKNSQPSRIRMAAEEQQDRRLGERFCGEPKL